MHLPLTKRQCLKIEFFNQHHPAYEIRRHPQNTVLTSFECTMSSIGWTKFSVIPTRIM